jgi:uncharacterized damage-inducible protein DinB/putative sterol carrier protein
MTTTTGTFERLFRYRAQANREILASMQRFDGASPAREIALRILSHIHTVDRIFAANLTGAPHGYTSPNPEEMPSVETLAAAVRDSDQRLIGYVSQLDQAQLAEVIDFTFTDGKPGRMTREEMLMHLVVHGAGHWGQLTWLMTQNAVTPPADGFTTFLHKTEGPTRRRGDARLETAQDQPAASPPAALAPVVQDLDGSPAGTSAMSRLDELTGRMRAAVGSDSGLGKSLKFNLKGEGFIHIDGSMVTNEDRPADLTLTCSIDDLRALGQGRLTPTSALLSGRLHLSSMGVAIGLQSRMQALFARMPPRS